MDELVSSKDVALKQLKRSRDRIGKKVSGTPSENATPRSLIQGLLDAASVSKSAVHSLQAKRPRLTKSPQVPPLQKRRRSLRKSLGENTTPRTLIRNYLNEASPETPLEIPQQVQYSEEEKDHLLPNDVANLPETSTNSEFSISESTNEKLDDLPSPEPTITHQCISINHGTVVDSQSSSESSVTVVSNDKNDLDNKLHVSEQHFETTNSQEQQSMNQNISSHFQYIPHGINLDLQKGPASANDQSHSDSGEMSKELSEISSSRNEEPADLDLPHQLTIQGIIPDAQSNSESAHDENNEDLIEDNDNASEISEEVDMVTDTLMTEGSRNSRWKNLVTPRFPVTKRKVLDEIANDFDENISERVGKKHATIKRKPSSRNPSVPSRKSSSDANLPPSLVKSIFQHFSKRKVTKEALQVIQKGSSLFFKNISADLMAYCQHAGRSTIEIGDVELLMKRQGFVTTKQSLYSLIEKYMPLEYRQELIPVAQSGNRILIKRS